MKELTVYVKKKRPRKTKHDFEKMHQHQLDIIDRHRSLYKLPPLLRLFWEVVNKSGELITGQLKILMEKTGERWTYYKYWRLRKALAKELRRLES